MMGETLTGFDPSGSVTFWLNDQFIFTSGPFDREEVSTYTFQVRVCVRVWGTYRGVDTS